MKVRKCSSCDLISKIKKHGFRLSKTTKPTGIAQPIIPRFNIRRHKITKLPDKFKHSPKHPNLQIDK